MNIRKLINEELNKIFSKDFDVIKGGDIINHFPFSDLPEKRSGADWKSGVSGWGKVYVPGLDRADSLLQIPAKEDFFYREVQGPKMIHKYSGYISDFKERFGEEPLFKIDSSKKKVYIVNDEYISWKEESLNNMKSFFKY